MLRTAVMTAGVGVMLATAPALAATEKFTADLTAAAETPATTSTGTGKLTATLNTKTKRLSWVITYKGLTGKATAAHFHGPAKVGANAAPVVPITTKLTSPIKGYKTLTAGQISDLEAGLWYFNIHTAKYPNGEIRGQVEKAK